GGGNLGGYIQIDGGTLQFAGGNFVVSGGYYSGSTAVDGATVDFTGANYPLFGELSLSSGSVFLGDKSVTTSLTQTGGALSGTGTVTLFDSSFAGGPQLHSGSGKTLLAYEHNYNTTLSATLYLDGGRALENDGDLTLSGQLVLGATPF